MLNRGYVFNKYDPEYYSKWGLTEHDFTLLIGKLKLWFILHPDESYYCSHCKYMDDFSCSDGEQIHCTYGKKGKGKKRRAVFCLTWLQEGNYVK
jgi:hypothetical protein